MGHEPTGVGLNTQWLESRVDVCCEVREAPSAIVQACDDDTRAPHRREPGILRDTCRDGRAPVRHLVDCSREGRDDLSRLGPEKLQRDVEVLEGHTAGTPAPEVTSLAELAQCWLEVTRECLWKGESDEEPEHSF